MALKAGRVGVHPDDVDLNGHIKATGGDMSAYVKKTDAPGYNDILTETEASTTYLSISSASSEFQPKLVSGTNIKTINGNSLLGSGDLEIGGGGGGGDLSAYVKKVDAPGYDDILTQTSASSIYQTQSGMSSYQTVSGMSAYQTVSGMSSYVAKSEATGYDDILTQTDAEDTYMQIANMADYVQKSQAVGYNDILTNTNANANYVKKVDATGYNDILTQTNAATLYQTKLISGTSIKTVNGNSLLGSGDVSVSASLGIDTNNIIASGNAYTNSGVLDYTPSVDCYLLIRYSASTQFAVAIDGTDVDTKYQTAYVQWLIKAGTRVQQPKTTQNCYWAFFGLK